MQMNPVKIAKVTSIKPIAVNAIIHDGAPSPNVNVAHNPLRINNSLNVGKKLLIILNKPLKTMPKPTLLVRLYDTISNLYSLYML